MLISSDYAVKMVNYSNNYAESIGNIVYNISEKYDEVISSTQYKAISTVIKAANAVNLLASDYFTQIFPEEKLSEILYETVNFIKDYGEPFFESIVNTVLNVKKVVSFINLRKLKRKFLKQIKRGRVSYINNNQEQLTTSIIKMFSAVGRIIGAPETTAKFLCLFDIDIPPKITDNFILLNRVSLCFSFSKIVTKIRGYHYSKIMLAELKHEERIKFLELFIERKNNFILNEIVLDAEKIKILTSAELKEATRKVKENLSSDMLLLDSLVHAKNVHCANVINEKLKKEGKVVHKILKIKLEKKDAKLVELNAIEESGKFNSSPKNYLEELATERMQQPSKKLKLKRAIKAIHTRLKHRILTNRFSVITKSISWVSSLIGQLEIFGVIFPPIFSARKTVDAALTIISFADFFYQLRKNKEFYDELEAATGRNKRQNVYKVLSA